MKFIVVAINFRMKFSVQLIKIPLPPFKKGGTIITGRSFDVNHGIRLHLLILSSPFVKGFGRELSRTGTGGFTAYTDRNLFLTLY